jgi:hypothetical protein
MPTNDNSDAILKGPNPSPSPEPTRSSKTRMELRHQYEDDLLDFVVDRLELGVSESRIVDLLQLHSFGKAEAEKLVASLSADETLVVTHVGDLYEQELLDFVSRELDYGKPPEAVIAALKAHDMNEREARRLVNALVADPELSQSTKDAIGRDIARSIGGITAGIAMVLLGAMTWIGFAFAGIVPTIVLIGGTSCLVIGPCLIVLGLVLFIRSKAKPPRNQ